MSEKKNKGQPSTERGYQPKKNLQEGYKIQSGKTKPSPPSGTSVVKKKSKRNTTE